MVARRKIGDKAAQSNQVADAVKAEAIAAVAATKSDSKAHHNEGAARLVLDIRGELIAFAKSNAEDSEAQAKLNEKRVGTYTHGILAAIAAEGDVALFEQVCDAFMGEIRTNHGGIAVTLHCKAAKAKEGEPQGYLVPSAFSAMKSYMADAIRFTLPLIGDDGAPRAYSAVRKDVDKAKQDKLLTEAQGDVKVRLDVMSDVQSILQNIKDTEGESLAELAELVAAARMIGVNAVEARKASKAQAKAEKRAGDMLAEAQAAAAGDVRKGKRNAKKAA